MIKKDKIKILVVDDIQENIFVIESILAGSDVDLVSANSGEEALALCAVHSFALILLDVQMPVMDGFETAEVLRSISKTKTTPIIFVTAYSKEETAIFRGYEVGAIDYMMKPIDPIVLRSKVQLFKDLFEQFCLIKQQAEELKETIRELQLIKNENDRLESLSIEDPLTGLLNRRGIDRFTTTHWKNCLRYSLPISFVLFDIDCFKMYNDNYGHLRGDEVLQEVARIMENSAMRPEDVVGRFGGEEFIMCLANTDKEGTIKVVERFQENLKSQNIVHEYNKNVNYITTSVGICCLTPDVDSSVEEALKIADEQLYLAKEAGRNCYRLCEIAPK
ncbi:diguanylate cyclase [Psychromonas sp. MME2]|uniref:diguanylate cyclase n=1 Tax=unclassified Psychromonas TaxID=2614957 RepID=UPI00339BC701